MIEGAPTIAGARRAIIEAAENLFSRYGYAKATVTEIAAEAGLKKASLYYYFPTKEELFRVVIGRKRSDFRKCVESIVTMDSPATDRIEKYVMARCDYFRELRELSIVEFSIGVRNRPSLREIFERHARQELRWLRKLFDSGKRRGEFQISSSGKVAEVFLHILQGLRLRILSENEALHPVPSAYVRFRREIIICTEIYINGIRTRN